jgi:hypothetical protein
VAQVPIARRFDPSEPTESLALVGGDGAGAEQAQAQAAVPPTGRQAKVKPEDAATGKPQRTAVRTRDDRSRTAARDRNRPLPSDDRSRTVMNTTPRQDGGWFRWWN